MSLFLCPLCGKQSSVRLYDPTKFDPDIYAIQKVGLGRGRGFKVTNQYSILNKENPTVELIKDRILLLSKTLIDNECLTSKEILSTLKIQTTNPRTLVKKDKIIKNLNETAIFLKSCVNERDRKLQKKDSLIEDFSLTTITLQKKLTNKDAVSEKLTGKIEYLKRHLSNKDDLIESLTENAVLLNSKLNDKDNIIVDIAKETVYLKAENDDLKEQLNHRTNQVKKLVRIARHQKNKIIGDLAESVINLNDEISDLEVQLEHRTSQAKKLRRIVRKLYAKVDALEEQNVDLSEALIK